jgi:hypothetical protein
MSAFRPQLTQQGLGADQMVTEDAAGDIQEIAQQRVTQGIPDGRPLFAGRDDILGAQDGQMLGEGGLANLEFALEFLHALFAAAERLENPDPQRVRQGPEEFGLESLKLAIL